MTKEKRFRYRVLAVLMTAVFAMSTLSAGKVSAAGTGAEGTVTDEAAQIISADEASQNEVSEVPADEVSQNEEPEIPADRVSSADEEEKITDDYIIIDGVKRYLNKDNDADISVGMVTGSGDPHISSLSTLPQKYDSRDYGYVTPVKDQSSDGTCWSFTACAAAESSLLKKTNRTVSMDFSENQLAYFFYNHTADPLGLTAGDKTECTGYVEEDEDSVVPANYVNRGGNSIFTMMNMAAWETVLQQNDDSETDGYTRDIHDGTMYPLDKGLAYNGTYHLENAYVINKTDIASVKRAVMDYGAVGTMMYVAQSFYLMSENGYKYYEDTEDIGNVNHVVTIVGWDDTISADSFSYTKQKPAGDGAWLIKNSWGVGSKYMDQGYFWLSYYSFDQLSGADVVFDMGLSDNYARNYQYDGGCGSYDTSDLGYASVPAEGNIYTAFGSTDTDKTETIEAVGFGSYNTDVSYTVKIYTGVSSASDPESGTLAETQSGTTSYAGFYTVSLNKPVAVSKGEKYSVVIYASGSNSFMVDATYKNSDWIKFTSSTAKGQSFAKLNGSAWTDMNSKKVAMRVKAYTNFKKLLASSTVSAAGIADQDYTGSPIEPEFSLTAISDGKELIKGTDYTAEYESNTGIGTATVTCTGINDYSGTCSFTFNIVGIDMSKVSINDIPDQIYTGTALRPDVDSVYGGNELVNGTDYTLSYSNNVNPGEATVSVKGRGCYFGSVSKNFSIKSGTISMTSCRCTAAAGSYTGKPLRPVTVKYAGRTLAEGTDYTISYERNTDAGTASYTVKAKDTGFTGSISGSFVIKPAGITDGMVGSIPGQSYSQPDVAVTFDGSLLKRDTDYIIISDNAAEGGKSSITVSGMGNFAGSVTRTYDLVSVSSGATGSEAGAVDISSLRFDPLGSLEYTGSSIYPELYYYKDLEWNTLSNDCCTAIYSDNENVGKATVVAVGKGKMKGTKVLNFRITKADIASASAEIQAQEYTGMPMKPAVKVTWQGKTLTEGVDFSVTYSNNTKVGKTAKATINGKGNFCGRLTAGFTIKQRDIANDEALKIIPKYGKTAPGVTVKYGTKTLRNGTDYTFTYASGMITVKGCGSFKGSESKEFDNSVIKLTNAVVSAEAVPTQDYTGYAVRPRPDVYLRADGTSLEEGEDYILSYSNNVNISKGKSIGKITVNFIGGYSGKIYVPFTIASIDLAEADTYAPNIIYSGRITKPAVTVTYHGTALKAGQSYTADYKSARKETGEYSVFIYPVKNRTSCTASNGMITVSYDVVSANIASATVRFSNAVITAKAVKSGKTVTGYKAEPKPQSVKIGNVTYRSGTDYILSYGDNTLGSSAAKGATGIGYVDIIGKGSCCGSARVYFGFKR